MARATAYGLAGTLLDAECRELAGRWASFAALQGDGYARFLELMGLEDQAVDDWLASVPPIVLRNIWNAARRDATVVHFERGRGVRLQARRERRDQRRQDIRAIARRALGGRA